MEIKGDALEKKLQEIRDQTEGWVARWINKPVSFALTRQLVKTPVTPNQITAVNLLLAGAAAFCLSRLEYGWRVLGAFLMYFSSIIDGCDGEVAQLKGLSSKFGAWFDTVADDLSNNLFFAALFVGLHQSTGKIFYWNIGWGALSASIGASLVIYHQLLTKRRSANAKDFMPAWQQEIPPNPPLSKGGDQICPPLSKGGDQICPPLAKGGRGDFWFEKLRPVMKRDFFIAVIFVFVVVDLRPVVFWMAVGAIGTTFILYLVSFVMQVSKE